MNILVLDNYDSFTYNLVHQIEKLIQIQPDVFRNDEITLEEVEKYDKILLSPGPGIPDEANLLKPIIETYKSSKSIMGVCLGMQAIAEVYGGSLLNTKKVFHGVATESEIIQPEELLFQNLPKKITTGRYHSWVVNNEDLPNDLEITALGSNREIMALSHKTDDVRGVQFHPESILTPFGDQMIKNWLEG